MNEMKIIAAMVRKLGGEVVITEDEMTNTGSLESEYRDPWDFINGYKLRFRVIDQIAIDEEATP